MKNIILASDEHGENDEKMIVSSLNTATTSQFSTTENKNEINDTNQPFRL